MPTYINPNSRSTAVHFTIDGVRMGGTLYPYAQRDRAVPGALYEVSMPADKAANYVRTGVLALKPEAFKPSPVIAVEAEPIPVPDTEPEEIVIPPTEDKSAPADEAPVVTEAADESTRRKGDITEARREHMRRVAKERIERLRAEKEAAAKAKAEDKDTAVPVPPGRATMDESEESSDEEEDSGDDILDDTTELPPPARIEDAAEVAKEETAVIKNPIPRKAIPGKKRFAPKLED